MSWIKQLNDAVMESLEETLNVGDIELYNEIKQEYWIRDFTDLMEEREWITTDI